MITPIPVNDNLDWLTVKLEIRSSSKNERKYSHTISILIKTYETGNQ